MPPVPASGYRLALLAGPAASTPDPVLPVRGCLCEAALSLSAWYKRSQVDCRYPATSSGRTELLTRAYAICVALFRQLMVMGSPCGGACCVLFAATKPAGSAAPGLGLAALPMMLGHGCWCCPGDTRGLGDRLTIPVAAAEDDSRSGESPEDS